MNAFLSVLKQHDLESSTSLYRGKLMTLQVNMGNVCNQNCQHCHIEASPSGTKIMSEEVVNCILAFLSSYKMNTLDITGGAPELNPSFQYFVSQARGLVDEIIVRSNLTVLVEKENGDLPDFYKRNNIHLICSLPCYLEKNVDAQRGDDVFLKSIKALRKLNSLGYAKEPGLPLDLVYNPVGAHLPPRQEDLEQEYKRVLKNERGISFNRLITITNVPIKRFKKYLKGRGEYDQYRDLLKENFNPHVLDNLMCRTFLSVGYDGKLYDCDFNQALGLSLKNQKGEELKIDTLTPDQLIGREIIMGEHCLSCTAGSGSSCQGALDQQGKEAADSGKDTKETVKEYYGKILKHQNDLKTSACCSTESFPDHHKEILKKIEPEILNRFYGCGSPLPPGLEGKTVLDLGCGTGRDVYLASYLVGERGMVYGVDMTEEQLDVARRYQKDQMIRFGYQKDNVKFLKGYIEDLKEIGIADNSVDVVISNCVINLSPDKESVLSEIFRVLKPGGELYFADVFADRRLSDEVKKDPVFYGECLGGALYIEDFRRILKNLGCLDYRIVSNRKIILNNKEMQEKAGLVGFYSSTVRAFKIDSLEDVCEDYGQVAIYLGTMKYCPHQFMLDDHHVFLKHKPMLVCGNTVAMVGETRYAKHFQIIGDRSCHYGVFDCSPSRILADDSLGCC